MSIFPISSFIYIFNGTMAIIYAFRYLRIYRKTANKYSKDFFYLGIWAGIGEYLYGAPPLFYGYFIMPQFIKGIIWLTSSFFLFLGINEAIYVAMIAWNKEKIGKSMKYYGPFAVGLFVLLNVINMPNPQIDSYGLLHWNVPYPFNIIWFVGGLLITIIPALFLYSSKTESKKAMIKKMFFSITFFLGGLGGWGTVIVNDPFLLSLSFAIFFLGFLSLGIIILIDIFMKEEKNDATDKQVFAS